MKDKRVSIAIKAIAIVVSIYGMFRWGVGPLTFTYFTNLSNVAIDVALLMSLVYDVKILKGTRSDKPNWMYIFKYMMTISITITFLVYMFLLAPATQGGVLHAYFAYGATSFCVHFFTPVVAIIDFFIYDYEYKSNLKHILYAITPPLVYIVFVVVLASFGVHWGTMKAPYNFLNFGAPCGWFGMDTATMSSDTLGIGVAYMIVVLVIIFALIGMAYLKIKDMVAKANVLKNA